MKNKVLDRVREHERSAAELDSDARVRAGANKLAMAAKTKQLRHFGECLVTKLRSELPYPVRGKFRREEKGRFKYSITLRTYAGGLWGYLVGSQELRIDIRNYEHSYGEPGDDIWISSHGGCGTTAHHPDYPSKTTHSDSRLLTRLPWSRVTGQAGIDEALEALEDLLAEDISYVVGERHQAAALGRKLRNYRLPDLWDLAKGLTMVLPFVGMMGGVGGCLAAPLVGADWGIGMVLGAVLAISLYLLWLVLDEIRR